MRFFHFFALAVVAFTCLPPLAAQSYGRYQNCTLQTTQGQAVSGASVWFLTQPANVSALTPLAAVYSSSTGGPATQPLVTDGFGSCAAYLTPGVYTVVYQSPYTGTLVYPDQNISIGGGSGGSSSFGNITSGTNTTAAMLVGSGASLMPSGNGQIGATSIDGISVSGTPAIGQTLVATSPTAAVWGPVSPGGVSSFNSRTGAVTLGLSDVTGALVGATNCGLPGYTFSPSSGTCLAANGITSLSGDVIAGPGGGSQAATLTAVTTAACPNLGGTIVCFDAKGRYLSSGSPFTANFACAQCGQPVEIGSNIGVSGTVSYANPSVPTSASVSDGTNAGSIPSPYTAWSMDYSYCTVAQGLASYTYTLTATGAGQTVTPTQSLSCLPRVFAGVGTAAATGATASGTSATLVGATGTLANGGLSASQVGLTFAAQSPNNQKVYLLLIGTHTSFKDALTGFAMVFNAPTAVSFINANGATVAMELYESTNLLTGNFQPQVVN